MSRYFYYGVYVPSLDQKLYFKELTIQQLKNIIKTILNNDDNALSLCFNQVIKDNCREEDIDKFELTIFDRFLILLNMRVISIGSIQKLQVTCNETNNVFSITVDYNQLITQLENLKLKNVASINQKNIILEYGIPLINHNFLNMDDNIIDKLIKTIRRIKIGNMEYNLLSLNFYDINRIIELLPKSLTDNILDYLDQKEKEINKIKFIDIINPYTNKKIEQTLSLDNTILFKILKLTFKEDLHALYKSIYYMVNILHFTPEYVEQLTINEKQLYWSYYLTDEKEKQKGTKQTQNNIPIKDATGDFLRDI